jgi:hypothetical protein
MCAINAAWIGAATTAHIQAGSIKTSDQGPGTGAEEMAKATQAHWIYGILTMNKSRKLHEHTSLSPFRLICQDCTWCSQSDCLSIPTISIHIHSYPAINVFPRWSANMTVTQALPTLTRSWISQTGEVPGLDSQLFVLRDRDLIAQLHPPSPWIRGPKWPESRRFTADSLSVAPKNGRFQAFRNIR